MRPFIILSMRPSGGDDLLFEISGLAQKVWVKAFKHVSVQEALRPLEQYMHGRETIILGHEARAVVGLPTRPWLLPQEEKWGTWRALPQPSGRCQLYNDPVFRRTVGMLLKEMAGHG